MNTSFESIWLEFNSPMKAYVKKHISNDQDAEDILQSIFLKIHNNIDKHSDVSKLSSWIYTIARNTMNDFYQVKNNDLYIDNLPDNIFIEQQNEETLN